MYRQPASDHWCSSCGGERWLLQDCEHERRLEGQSRLGRASLWEGTFLDERRNDERKAFGVERLGEEAEGEQTSSRICSILGFEKDEFLNKGCEAFIFSHQERLRCYWEYFIYALIGICDCRCSRTLLDKLSLWWRIFSEKFARAMSLVMLPQFYNLLQAS